MLKFVDGDEGKVISGFAYHNQDGEVETVLLYPLDDIFLDIKTSSESVTIYTKDIPKLILALQEAYKHLGEPV